jgi:hypothetical protein
VNERDFPISFLYVMGVNTKNGCVVGIMTALLDLMMRF